MLTVWSASFGLFNQFFLFCFAIYQLITTFAK